MPKVTVIMPSLNVAKYIRPCVESVLNQSMKDMEILAIDAGSTDGTLEILEAYAAGDKRLRIIHADKKSYGYQVNLGIELAAGEYLGIVETDDMIAPCMYEKLYQTAKAQDLEYCKGGFTQFVESENGLQWKQSGGRCILDVNLLGKCFSPKNMPELATQDYYIWAGIYRKDFLRDIRLSETPGAAFQDIGFIYQVLCKAERAVYLAEEFYDYRQTRGNSSFNKNGFRYLIEEYRNLREIMLQQSDAWRQAYYERLFRQTVGRFQRMAVSGRYWEETEGDIQVLQIMLRQAQADGAFSPDKLDEVNREIYDTLQDNPRGIFTREYQSFCLKTERLRGLLDFVEDREIVIFGCGSYGRYIHTLLETYRAGRVKAFCDNNRSLWNTSLQGIGIFALEEAGKRYQDCRYIIANARNAEAIREQLLKSGIAESRMYAYQPDFDVRLFML